MNGIFLASYCRRVSSVIDSFSEYSIWKWKITIRKTHHIKLWDTSMRSEVPLIKAGAEVSHSCTNYYTSVSQLVVKEKLVLHNAPFPAKIHY